MKVTAPWLAIRARLGRVSYVHPREPVLEHTRTSGTEGVIPFLLGMASYAGPG
jgi:hypothetical protein